jgi:hypothetical protein
MSTSRTQIYHFQPQSRDFLSFRSGISLHSHTMHSREYLGRLPKYIAKFPVGSYILEREIGRVHLYEGRIFNFNKIYWTPPLSPREAYELESRQIEEQLGCSALVSLTDHDDIEAGLHLRLLEKTKHTPISVEWTVPFGKTEFHIGVHNLPMSRCRGWIKEFGAYRRNLDSEYLRDILAGLDNERNTLIVLNHPYWDGEGIGPDEHRRCLEEFLTNYLSFLHAIEVNGMRSRRENREVIALGEAIDRPVISGGDRHGCEPNATLNLSRASSFDEFVQEIRYDRRSQLVLMPQFFEPLPLRLIENAWYTLADAPGEFGRSHWMTRVFIEQDGESRPLTQFSHTRFKRVVEKFRWVMGLVTNPLIRPALRLPFHGYEEGGL